MSHTHFLAGLLAVSMAVGCKAQTTPPPADLTFNHEIAVIVRAQLSVPQDYTIIPGARKPSQMPGYDSLPITLANGTRSQVVDYLISTDGKTLAQLKSYNLATYPLFNVAGRPIRGNPAAPVTVITYDDLQCPYCTMMHQTLFPATLEHYGDKVRFIYKDYPLTSLHPWAMHAAVDANCLAAQSGDVYWAYVDYVHAHGQEVNGENRDRAASFATLDRIARQEAILAKLDVALLAACLAKQDETQVNASAKEAESLEIEGAPVLFVDGSRVGGAMPQPNFWQVIDRALRADGVEPPAEPAAAAAAQPAGAAK